MRFFPAWFHCLSFGISILSSFIGLRQAIGKEPKTPPPVDFVRDIEPILRNRCIECHGSSKQKGGLRLDRRADALKGGDSGRLVVAKNPDQSVIFQRITHKDDELRMPAKGEKLGDDQIASVRRWIEEGAVWPKEDGIDPRKKHWAFQPVVRPGVPTVKNRRWPGNAIDSFILARLEKEKLSPSPEADRLTLIRRLKFDLLGLPPSPREVDAFLKDNDAGAYEKLVDRYLASPQFGERWARHWLDVVRFAESDGFETNQPRANAWPYRDYVIRAFNEDKPFDRFIVEQLAGDGLGEDAATGFLVAGGADRVKSPDINLTLQQRADELHDMISTTGSAFLGLTVGCARCHNHKFDPISQVDYYGMKAMLSGVQHGERPMRTGDPAERQKQTEAIRKQLETIEQQLVEFELLASVRREGHKKGTGLRPAVNARRNVERFAPVEARFVRMVIEQTTGAEPCIDELEVFTAEPGARNIALANLGTKATASSNLPGHAIHKIEHVNDGRYGNSRSWISNQSGQGWIQLEFPKPVKINRIIWGRDREGKFPDRLPTRYRFEVAIEAGKWMTVASSADRLVGMGSIPELTGSNLNDADKARFKQLNEKRLQLEAKLAELSRSPLVYAGQFTSPEPVYRLHRGEVMQKRELISPQALSEFGAKLQLSERIPDQDRRLALAKWMVDPKHPLTARVIVNRLWQHHFGTGIIDTPSDCGLNGSKPTHPELLDYLAAELIEHSWKLKAIHKQIVMSATYRQASKSTQLGLSVDGSTRLLWRYPPRRLEAEAIRDSILFVSGKLDTRMGGPGFDLFEPNTNYVKVYTPKKEFGPAEFRRMIYQSKPRMQLDNIFGTFDCPDAGQIAPKRTRSTTPLQALSLLNSPFLMQQAKFLSERIASEVGTDVEAQVQRAFLLAFQREPTKEELKAGTSFASDHGLTALCRALLNANEFIYVY